MHCDQLIYAGKFSFHCNPTLFWRFIYLGRSLHPNSAVRKVVDYEFKGTTCAHSKIYASCGICIPHCLEALSQAINKTKWFSLLVKFRHEYTTELSNFKWVTLPIVIRNCCHTRVERSTVSIAKPRIHTPNEWKWIEFREHKSFSSFADYFYNWAFW